MFARALHLKEQPLARLLPYLRHYRTQLIAGSAMVLLTNLVAVVAPWILREAVDELATAVSRQRLGLYALLIAGVSLVEGTFRFLMRRTLIGMSRRIEFDLRNDLFAHLQRLSPGFYHRNPTGDLMARATNDLSAVRSVLGPGIMYSLNTLSTTILTVSLLVSINARLALLTLVPLAMVTITVKYIGKLVHQRFERIQEQFSKLTTLAQEDIAGIRVVKAYGQESAFAGRFEKANDEYMRRSLSLVKIQGAYNPSLVFLLGLSALGVLWYGGGLVIAGTISLGDLVAFMSYLAMLAWPTIALGWVINVVQ